MVSVSLEVRRPIPRALSSLIALVGVGFLIAIWSLLSYGGLIGPLFLPTPTAVLSSLVDLVQTKELFIALVTSFGRIWFATILSVAVGFPIGVLMGAFPAFDAFFNPYTQPMRYVPLTALLPLFILWFGIGSNMKVAFLFAGTVFYFIPLVRNAVRSVPEGYVEVALDIGLSRWQILTRILLWGSLPQVWAGLVVCNAIGWTYVVLAEIINPESGIGYLISIAGRLQRTDQVFAYVMVISVLALITDRVLTLIGRKYFDWLTD